ncbi:hypothetical protein FRB95_004548 [Tulasnella sp. JGI-2019a]|nr:hypothetical protein FRB95_004548 [Tulasnella sp. JGI-2019a]
MNQREWDDFLEGRSSVKPQPKPAPPIQSWDPNTIPYIASYSTRSADVLPSPGIASYTQTPYTQTPYDVSTAPETTVTTDLYDACRYFAWPPVYRNVSSSDSWNRQHHSLPPSSFAALSNGSSFSSVVSPYGGLGPSQTQARQDPLWATSLQRGVSPAISMSSSSSSSSLAGAMDLPPEMANVAPSPSQSEYQQHAFSPASNVALPLPRAQPQGLTASMSGSLIIPRGTRYIGRGSHPPQTCAHQRSSSASSAPTLELQHQSQSQLWSQPASVPTSSPLSMTAVDPTVLGRGLKRMPTDDQANSEAAYHGHQQQSTNTTTATEPQRTSTLPPLYQRADVRSWPLPPPSSTPSLGSTLPRQLHNQFRVSSPASVHATLNATQQQLLATVTHVPELPSRPSNVTPASVPIPRPGSAAINMTTHHGRQPDSIQQQVQLQSQTYNPVQASTSYQQEPRQSTIDQYLQVGGQYQGTVSDISGSSSNLPFQYGLASGHTSRIDSGLDPSASSNLLPPSSYQYTEEPGLQGFDYLGQNNQQHELLQQGAVFDLGKPQWSEQLGFSEVDTTEVGNVAVGSDNSNYPPPESSSRGNTLETPEYSEAASSSSKRTLMRAVAGPSVPRIGLRMRKPPAKPIVPIAPPSGAIRPRKIFPAPNFAQKGLDIHITPQKRFSPPDSDQEDARRSDKEGSTFSPRATKRLKRKATVTDLRNSEDEDAEGDDESGGDNGDTKESSYAAMFSHVHVMNIPCPHPACSLTAAADGREKSKLWNFKPGEKRKAKGMF